MEQKKEELLSLLGQLTGAMELIIEHDLDVIDRSKLWDDIFAVYDKINNKN